MSDAPLIRNISDTAFWAAAYRALESERSDAHFHDPHARALAGERGFDVMHGMPTRSRDAWAWVTRTVLVDRLIQSALDAGADMVINVAAGLDARPYRMELRSSLKWIEVDLPDVVEYKSEVLKDARPRCALERIALDVADEPARRELFSRFGAESHSALVITEGLLIYLTPAQVESLAGDLSAQPSFQRWIIDLVSPTLLKILQRAIGGELSAAGAPLKFSPEQGLEFFPPLGWRVREACNMLKTGAKLKRLPFALRVMSLLMGSKCSGKHPWSVVCMLERT